MRPSPAMRHALDLVLGLAAWVLVFWLIGKVLGWQ